MLRGGKDGQDNSEGRSANYGVGIRLVKAVQNDKLLGGRGVLLRIARSLMILPSAYSRWLTW